MYTWRYSPLSCGRSGPSGRWKTEAAISDTLPLSVCLGTDVPEWDSLLAGKKEVESERAFAVSTRAQRRREELREVEQHRKENACDVRPNSLGYEFDDELFSGSKDKARKSRRQKREERRRREQLQVTIEEEESPPRTQEKENFERPQQVSEDNVIVSLETSSAGASGTASSEAGKGEVASLESSEYAGSDLDVSAEELKAWQREDATLKVVWDAVKKCEAKSGIGFFTQDGRTWHRARSGYGTGRGRPGFRSVCAHEATSLR